MRFIVVLVVVVLALGLLSARTVTREPFGSALVLDDAERRELARSGLVAARAAAFNALPTISTKVPANCFDTTDPAYDTAQCRAQRNTRDAQIATLVQQAYVNYCKAAPGCQQPKRTQVVLNDYTAKCKTESASHLADIALLKSLLTTGGSPFVSLTGKRVPDTHSFASRVGQPGIDNARGSGGGGLIQSPGSPGQHDHSGLADQDGLILWAITSCSSIPTTPTTLCR